MKALALLLFSGILSFAAISQESWQLISQPGNNTIFADKLISYTYSNESVGSHGSKYNLLKSTDGGYNYTLIKSKTGEFGCYSIDEFYALDADNIYFAESCQGISAIIRSPDGGETWENSGYGGAFSISMFFLRDDFGYYSFYPGAPNDSYFMQNGSAIFITSKYVFANGYPVPDQTTEIFFKNDSTGLIMCRDSSGNNVVIATEDYGHNWTEKLSFAGGAFNDMHFINDSIGFVSASTGNLFRTTSFGDSWEHIVLPGGIELNSIDFNAEGTGYIAGDQGTIYKSDDEGLSWEEFESPGANEYIYIRVFGQDLVYTLDDNGNLYSIGGGADLNEIRPDMIALYPNPAKSLIHIRLPEGCRIIENSIYDMHGRKLLSNKDNTLRISGFTQGFYVLEMHTSKGVFRKKFFIE